MIVALTSRQWASLVAATDLGEACASIERMMDVDLSDEGGRFTARELIGATLRPWLLSRSMAEVREIFDAHDVCWGPYQTFTELVEQDPRCSPANPLFANVEQPGIGTYRMPGSPLVFGAAERLAPQRAPTLGEHTEEVLADVLGLSDAEIGRLLGEGVVAGAAAITAQ
jgi:2-methylfumaryl-CoA isomerase